MPPSNMKTNTQESTGSLRLRNFIFTLLQPGLVAGVIPYYILGGDLSALPRPGPVQLYAGLALFLVGVSIMLRCILQFALEGRGTLSPVDPTKRLVVRGLYRFSRNPMYVGVMLILIGEAIMAQSVPLWIYLVVVFIAFNLFIVLHEEPRLRKDFGQEYLDYCQKVRRWI
jgi:protein-S-isoprenylcysteine O-methyltransferase Ste14